MRVRWIAAGVAIAAFLDLAWCGGVSAGLRGNWSESMPRGIWWAEKFDGVPHRGDIVMACVPYSDQIVPYLGHGSCPGGIEPVLKVVAAIEGDEIEMGPSGSWVNGAKLENSQPMQSDSQGLKLKRWPYGTYHVAHGEVYLFSTHSPRSYDARYVGPVAVSAIFARGVPVFVWK